MLAVFYPCVSRAFMKALSESRISQDSLPEQTFLNVLFFPDAYLGTLLCRNASVYVSPAQRFCLLLLMRAFVPNSLLYSFLFLFINVSMLAELRLCASRAFMKSLSERRISQDSFREQSLRTCITALINSGQRGAKHSPFSKAV